MKGLRVTKNVKAIKFEGVWGDLESKKKFLETIIHKISEINSCQIAHNGKGLFFIFQEFSSSINKTFILARRLGTGLSFYKV